MLDLNLSSKDRAWHLANAQPRFIYKDGTWRDLLAFRSGFEAMYKGLPPWLERMEQGRLVRFRQSLLDPTLYLEV